MDEWDLGRNLEMFKLHWGYDVKNSVERLNIERNTYPDATPLQFLLLPIYVHIWQIDWINLT